MTGQNNGVVQGKQTKQKQSRKPAILVILLVVLAIMFVFSTVITVIGYDIWRVMFNGPLVKQMLADELIESDLVPLVLEDISRRRAQQRIESGESLSGVNEPDILLLISYVGFDRWASIKDLVITEVFVTDLVSASVDGLYTWVDSTDPTPKFVWEMSPLKERLIGQAGEDAILIAYHALPECTTEEINDFLGRLEAAPPGVEVLYNLCQFPEPWQEDQIDDYVNALLDVNQNISEKYDFGEMLADEGGPGPKSIALFKTILRFIRFLGQWGWVIPLGLLIVIAVIGVRSLGDAGSWLGIPLLISGGFVVGFAFLAQNALVNAARETLSANASNLLRAELTNTVTRLSGHVFEPMLLQGGILAGLGIVLIVVGLMTTSKLKQSTLESGTKI